MTTVLVTGFEPFGDDARNPSGEAVRAVEAAWDGAEELATAILPVSYDDAEAMLRDLIRGFDPDVVIATGLAGGRDAVTPERVAINLRDARIPDNAGAQPIDQPCVEGGPAAHFSSLPVKAIARAVEATGVPSAVSHTAGTFVCNHVFYVAAEEAARRPGMRAGFIHVPWSTESAPEGASGALPAADIERALLTAIRTAVDTGADDATAAGTLH